MHEQPATIETKYGPLEVRAGAHHLHASLPEGATVRIFGKEHKSATVDANIVHLRDGVAYLDGYDHERAAYTATSGNTTVGTTWHGYGANLWRADGILIEATEAARKAFRAEVLPLLAAFADSPEGRRLMALGRIESAERAHGYKVDALKEAQDAEHDAAVEVRAARAALEALDA
jgi:hypothetical protein